jgi:hypothetical protein
VSFALILYKNSKKLKLKTQVLIKKKNNKITKEKVIFLKINI